WPSCLITATFSPASASRGSMVSMRVVLPEFFTPETAITTLLPTVVHPRLAALLVDQVDLAQFHALVDGLAHVVDGEQGHRYSGKGFHLHARFAGELYGALCPDGARL